MLSPGSWLLIKTNLICPAQRTARSDQNWVVAHCLSYLGWKEAAAACTLGTWSQLKWNAVNYYTCAFPYTRRRSIQALGGKENTGRGHSGIKDHLSLIQHQSSFVVLAID